MYILPNGSIPYFKIGKMVRFTENLELAPIYEFEIKDISPNSAPEGDEIIAKVERGETQLTYNELWMLAICLGNNLDNVFQVK